jgi:two-component system, OmpR family, response regulator MprA
MEQSILVVDNKRYVAEVLVELLDEEGYRVRYAFDGQAALSEIARNAPDLVLADVMVPKVDGISLAKQLRAQGTTIPVVLMSAFDSAVDVPGLPFVPKPFNLDALLRVITRALEDHNSEEADGTTSPFRASKRPRAEAQGR